MPKVLKSQLIELVLPGVAGGNLSTKVQFQDQPYLREKKIFGIEVLNVADVTLSPTGKTPISNANMLNSYLTLYLNDVANPRDVGEWIQNVPFTLMHRVQNASNNPFVRQMFELQGQTIYWEKCYVNLAAPFSNVTDVSFLFNVYFK